MYLKLYMNYIARPVLALFNTLCKALKSLSSYSQAAFCHLEIAQLLSSFEEVIYRLTDEKLNLVIVEDINMDFLSEMSKAKQCREKLASYDLQQRINETTHFEYGHMSSLLTI